MRILIAEDDVTSRSMLAAVLQKNGHEVIEAENGAEAWEVLQRPDAPLLAIIDWMMPVMDGPEVVELVRTHLTARPPHLILLTIKSDKADIIAGLNAGANDYLSKPFDPGELHARVEVGRRMVELQAMLAAKITELGQALEQIKTLRGIVPICASCKKIRDDSGYWRQVEAYLHDHTDATFTHGICPTCMEKLYPEFEEDDA